MLGGLTALRSGHEVFRFQNRKTGSLLGRLAYSLNEYLSRDTIVELLWPDVDVEKGRHSLSQSLLSLRHQFEPPDIDPGSVLQVDNARIRLNAKVVQTDVLRFKLACNKAQRSASHVDRIGFLRRAVSTYGGDLLPGFHDDWILQEREQVTALYVHAIRKLVLDLKDAELLEEALEHALQVAKLLPGSDKAHLEVIGIQIKLGLSEQAIMHYRDYADRLQRDYGRSPGRVLQESMAPYTERLRQLPKRGRRASRLAIASNSIRPAAIQPTPPVPRATVPSAFNRFFGRETEVSQVTEFLESHMSPGAPAPVSGYARLMTVVGMGGFGKTRIVVEAANRLRTLLGYRVAFVSLSNLAGTSDVDHAILSALAQGQSSIPAGTQVRAALNNERWVLLMDNCEQLMPDIATFVRSLLEDLPHLCIVATSRMPLALNGEQVLPLMPFTVPHGISNARSLYEFPCVQMFVDRAQSVNPDFQITPRNCCAITSIVERLEGIPLAIELAATHAHALTPSQMVEALADRFKLLVTRQIRDRRHRALSDTVAWSFGLLPRELQSFFGYLPVFRGSFTAEAASEITGIQDSLPLLEALVERSLVVAQESNDTMRFSLLETLREFVLSRSDHQLLTQARKDHANYYLRWTRELFQGERAVDRRAWMEAMDEEHHNLLAAIECVCGHGEEVQLVAQIWRYWHSSGYIEPGIQLIRRALVVDNARLEDRAEALHGLGAMLELTDVVHESLEAITESLRIYESTHADNAHARVLNTLAVLLEKRGELTRAHEIGSKGLDMIRRSGTKRDIAACLNTLGRQRRFEGDRSGALEYLREALTIFEQAEDWDSAAAMLNNIGCIASDLGNMAEARTAFERSLALFRDLSLPEWTAYALHNLGDTKAQQGDIAGAEASLFEAIQVRMGLGDHSGIAMSLETLATTAHAKGDTVRAVHIVAAASALRLRFDTPITPASLPVLQCQIEKYRSALTEIDYNAAWSFGFSMTMETAVRYAIEQRLIPMPTLEYGADGDYLPIERECRWGFS
jgi:predicted ATPase/DNA-binding SARP family transcriptional activator